VRWSVFFLVLAPVLAGGVAVYLGRKVARPVRFCMRRGTPGPRRSRHAHCRGRDDEFGDLARQFNTMVASLKEQQHRLLRANAWLASGA